MWKQSLVVCLLMAMPLPAQDRDLHNIGLQVQTLSEQGNLPAVKALVTGALKEGGRNPDLVRTGTLLLILANVNQVLGDFEEADIRFRAAISALERAGIKAALTLAQAQVDYASLIELRSGGKEAERRRLLALGVFQRELGPDHPETLRTQGQLALGYYVRRDYARAEQLCREVIRAAQSTRLYPEVCLARDLLTLGSVLLKTGRAGEATEAFQRSAAIATSLFGPDHPALLNSWLGMAKAYAAMRQYATAEELLLRADGVAVEYLGPAHPMRVQVLTARCELLRATGRRSEAKALAKSVRNLAKEPENRRHTVSWVELTGTNRE